SVLSMLVIGGTGSVSGAVVGTVVVTFLREGLRAIENSANIAGLFQNNLVGFTEVVLSLLLILILVFRPSGILGSQEIRLSRLNWFSKGLSSPAKASFESSSKEGEHV
ncbi:MAG: hypothetical protein N3D16_09345, partial [Anaerolineales bacterium]|nr:hypothetical protein [Anaerolineales bacterium]